jgi:hypothetical protein
VQADRRLQVGPLQRLAQHAAVLAVHADVDVGLDQARHVGQVAAQREHHVHLGADALHQAADLGQVAGHVEGAVARADDVDARLFAGGPVLERLALRHLAQPVLAPQPEMARLAHCHWSSSMVRGRKRWIVVPSGVTPPPIISAIEPVTTTLGRSGSSVAWARFIAPSVPSRPSCSSARPVTTIGNSCGGSASV